MVSRTTRVRSLTRPILAPACHTHSPTDVCPTRQGCHSPFFRFITLAASSLFRYTFLADGRLAATYKDKESGHTKLIVVADGDESSAHEYGTEDGLPPSFGGLAPAPDNTLYFLGGAPQAPGGVMSWLGLRNHEGSCAAMLACSSSASVDEGYISVPEPVAFPTTLGTAYGYYYAPRNAGSVCTTEAAPPLLVKAHGGPTACTGTNFNPTIQYFTSRGFAVLDVDYGGSTGCGPIASEEMDHSALVTLHSSLSTHHSRTHATPWECSGNALPQDPPSVGALSPYPPPQKVRARVPSASAWAVGRGRH